MWFKVVSVVLLVAQFAAASLDCDGSAINVDGFVDRPSKSKAALGEFPWVVALYKKDAENLHCAGSIIDETTVITSAFCVKL
jgi:secreted trypsin-like serine protease